MDISIFTDKTSIPNESNLKNSLGNSYSLWKTIQKYILSVYPGAIEEWNFPGIKYGWSFRIKDTKRAIIYLLPRDKYFKVAFVFGQKATYAILKSKISTEIKNELEEAKVYAEGRGIRLDVKDERIIHEIIELIDIKLAF
jgi:hypothetical protein